MTHLVNILRQSEGVRMDRALMGLLRRLWDESSKNVDWSCRDVANVRTEIETFISHQLDGFIVNMLFQWYARA